MSDLTPEDETLLARARRGGEATVADRKRVKRKVFMRIGIGVGASAISTAGGASAGFAAGGAATGAGLAASTAKIVVVLALGAGAGTGAFAAYGSRHAHEGHRASSATMVAPTTAAPARPAPSPIVEASGSSSEPLALALTTQETLPPPLVTRAPRSVAPNRPSPSLLEPRTIESRATEPRAIEAQEAEPRAIEPRAPATVGLEADLLREADGALKAGHPARALALLQEHTTRFPSGILIEEREAERVVVLCALGRTDEARVAASRFSREHPRSPLGRRVRESCGG